MGRLFLALTALAVVVPFPASIAPKANAALYDARGKARKEFRALWEERLATYTAKLSELAATHKAAADRLVVPNLSIEANDSRLTALYSASFDDARNSGRGKLLEQFLKQTAGKASPGVLRAWLQGQVDQQRLKDDEALAAQTRLKSILDGANATIGEFLVAIEMAAMTRGESVGHGEELLLIIDNFSAYSGEMAQAAEKDAEMRRRIAAALGAMGRSLQQPQGWTATCVQTGTIVNCSGR